MRRPKLTKLRIEGLSLIARAIEVQLEECTDSTGALNPDGPALPEVESALQYLYELRDWSDSRKCSGADSNQ